jgi:hypothetical protein
MQSKNVEKSKNKRLVKIDYVKRYWFLFYYWF